MSRVAVLLGRAAPVCTLLLAWAAPASAHAILVASTPAIGGHVAPGPVTMILRYNSRIDQGRSRLTLTHPDQALSVLPVAPGSEDDTLESTAPLTRGAYVLHWQVLAVDGHITRGDVPFTVAAP